MTEDSSAQTAVSQQPDAASGPAGEHPPGGAAPDLRERIAKWQLGQRFGLLIVWAILVVVFSLLRPDTFATSANWQSMLASQAVLLVLALGLIVPLRAGDFDLAVGSTMALVAMIVASLNVNSGWPIVPAIVIGLACGLVIGFVNGALVVKVGINSFIATLGTATVMTGIVQWISHSNVVTGVSREFSKWVIDERFLGISLSFWYGVVLCLIAWYVIQFTSVGQRLLFVGRSQAVARLSGVRVDRVRWVALIVSAEMAAIAGVILVGTQAAADPAAGGSFLLPAFAAAYLGSTAITPGRFNAIGTFMAVYFLVTGITGLQLLGVENFVQDLFYGTALIVAVGFAQLAGRRSARSTAVRR